MLLINVDFYHKGLLSFQNKIKIYRIKFLDSCEVNDIFDKCEINDNI